MYKFGSEVYDSIGETELQQYIRFKKYNPKFKFSMNKIKVAKPPAGYSYHVEALSSTDILIEERNGKVPTGGGSSFLVRSDSVSTQICHYDDFFNGTYVVHCPLPECTCRNISVWLQHANYTAFTCVHYPIEKLLWRKRSCNLRKGNVGFTKTSRESKTSSNGKNIVTWYLENRLWITRSADKTVPSVGSRNNFALAALNRKLKTELLSKKVNVFDEFSILLPQQNRNSCGCHFMCRGIKNNKTYIYGRVGIVAASMLVYNEIC
ncbi:hypothetical protein LSAT2_013612 [Lamellibrachia satsuma]|nr:hypothetical protein LSAT2_013612 [Lamellibrachia satsuma]